MRAILGGIAAALALAAPAQAEQAVGLIDAPGDALVMFDTAVPGQFGAVRQVTGLGLNEHLVGLDYRAFPLGDTATPAGLFGLGIIDEGITDTARLYRIDPGTGAATAVGVPITGLDDGTDYGVDIYPVVDRLRVVSDADENMRINPNTGVRSDNTDTNLNPGGVVIDAVAFDRNDGDTATGSTLFGVDVAAQDLVRIGGVDNTPSANFGTASTVGPLGLPVNTALPRNFDISTGGTAYLTAVGGPGLPDLYTVNLGTGAATRVGAMPSGLRGLAVVPAAAVQFAADTAIVTEGATAVLTVTRGGATTSTATAHWATSGVTASADDFTVASGDLTFAAGETTKTIEVSTTGDGTDEPDETLTITLSDPGPAAALGTPATTTLTVADDDAPVVMPPAATPDVSAPTLALAGIPKTVKFARLIKHGIRVRATPSESAALEFVLLGKIRRTRLRAVGDLTVARRVLPAATGLRTATLKPRRRLLARPKRSFVLRLRITATDATGNARSVTRRIKVVR